MYPADFETRNIFDASYVDFSADSQKMRLAPSNDGFEPFRHQVNHNIWLVAIVVYNLIS